MTKERPILFSAPMVRAILDGRKTQTRRMLNPQPVWDPHWGSAVGMTGAWRIGSPAAMGLTDRGDHWSTIFDDETRRRYPTAEAYGWGARAGCPYGQPGDHLYVRETWAQPAALDPGPTVYRADYPACVPAGYKNVPAAEDIRWKPSIHMPRALSRILLEITAVRVERLNDCSEADAIDGGIESRPSADGEWAHYADTGLSTDALGSYRSLWEQINGPRSWDANPFVWVVEFWRIA